MAAVLGTREVFVAAAVGGAPAGLVLESSRWVSRWLSFRIHI